MQAIRAGGDYEVPGPHSLTGSPGKMNLSVSGPQIAQLYREPVGLRQPLQDVQHPHPTLRIEHPLTSFELHQVKCPKFLSPQRSAMLITQMPSLIASAPSPPNLEPGPGKSSGQGCQDKEEARNQSPETQPRLGSEKVGGQGENDRAGLDARSPEVEEAAMDTTGHHHKSPSRSDMVHTMRHDRCPQG